MRILWLANTPGLYKKDNGAGGYNGGGWISALQQVIMTAKEIDLGYVFATNSVLEKETRDNVTYYPIYAPSIKGFNKLKFYWQDYKKWDCNRFVKEIIQVIDDYKPDIIHLFGMESQFATIIGKTKIPIVVHLQGILSPYDNAFWPIGINSQSLLFPITIKEYLLNNGFRFAKKLISVRAKYEKNLFPHVKYVMGRTNWDYQISSLLTKEAKYYKVNEVLRPSFYKKANSWRTQVNKKYIIVSTVSNTMYKGLDLILKTADILKKHSNINFEWHVIGISSKCNIVHFFEHHFNLDSKHVGVIYDGIKDENELSEILSSSHAYVHPSYIDNSPNSVCEAQMIGLPVLCTNVGGVSSLVEHRVNGILVPANAPYELAFWLKELHNNISLATNLGKKGAEDAQIRHSKSQILSDLIETYNCIIKDASHCNY